MRRALYLSVALALVVGCGGADEAVAPPDPPDAPAEITSERELEAVVARLENPETESAALRRLKDTLYSDGGEYFSYGIHRPIALQPGRYRVAFHAADDELTPIASGTYVVE